MRRAILAAGLVLSPMLAQAQQASTSLPTVDVEAECKTMSKGEIRSLNGCIDQNQDAYNSLKIVWGDTPEPVRRQAISMTESNPKLRPFYYVALQGYLVDLRRLYDYNHPTTRHFER